MAEPKNRQQFIELEYCFNEYFSQYFAPIIKSESERFRRNAEQETRDREDGGWDGYIDAASPFTTTYLNNTRGEWNRKTTEELLKSCNEKFFPDPKVQEDIRNMTIAYTAAIVSEIGEDRYKELSKGVPTGDLASFYVANRFERLFVEQLAIQKVPHSSFEFIMQKGIGDSLPGFLAAAQMKSSKIDEDVQNLAEKYYGASAMEHTAAFGLSFVLDTASTGGYSTAGKAATWLAIDGGVRLVGNVLPKDKNFDQLYGEAIWGDSNIVARLRDESRNVNPKKSEDLDTLNSVLNKHLYRPEFNEQEYRQTAHALRGKFRSSCPDYIGMSEVLVRGLEAVGFHVDKKCPYPQWMDKMSETEKFNSAVNWSAMAMEVKAKGIKQLKVGNKTYTAEELAQKGYDYSCALDVSANRPQSQEQSNSQSLEDIGIADPLSAGYLDKIDMQMVHLNQQAELHFAMREKFGDGSQQTASKEGVTEEQTTSQQGNSTSVAPGSTKSVGGWGGMLDQLGLSGFGTVGKNLGYVLAMLPDMLIGMFTGKSRNLKFGDNLLPIGAIIAGMFVKNPLLKMLLIGLGGANLLNKAGHEALDHRDAKSQPVRQYRTYQDEPLNMRIKQPVLKGNTLVVNIDNIPMVVTINNEAVDAYEKGVLPINTLANAVLRKYDEQQKAVAENYEQEVSQDNIVERSRGLK